jgi:hypothetical protein
MLHQSFRDQFIDLTVQVDLSGEIMDRNLEFDHAFEVAGIGGPLESESATHPSKSCCGHLLRATTTRLEGRNISPEVVLIERGERGQHTSGCDEYGS